MWAGPLSTPLRLPRGMAEGQQSQAGQSQPHRAGEIAVSCRAISRPGLGEGLVLEEEEVGNGVAIRATSPLHALGSVSHTEGLWRWAG